MLGFKSHLHEKHKGLCVRLQIQTGGTYNMYIFVESFGSLESVSYMEICSVSKNKGADTLNV